VTVWIIEPRDPLIFRDGRPFEAVPGAIASSLPFPFPSTTSGAVRTREGQDSQGKFRDEAISTVKEIPVQGPLLAEIDAETNDISRFLVRPPSDALLLELDPSYSAKADLRQLAPLQTNSKVTTNLPNGLQLVGAQKPDLRKPAEHAPRYWYWEFFQNWLMDPKEGEIALKDIGHDGPVREGRTHVGINPETRTADVEQGALFHTRGLEFTFPGHKPYLSHTRRLALIVETDAPNLRDGLGFLGGERRLVMWRKTEKPLPGCPASLRDEIVRQRHCRLILLTPGYFESGWKPQYLLNPSMGVSPKLRAIAVGRPQVASGWDMEQRRPKPARRLAPSGTVLFLELEGQEDSIRNWVDATWMSCVSDNRQDRLDGFGLAVLGVRDGTPRRMEV